MKTQVDSKLNVRQTLLQRRQTLAMFAGSAAIGLVGMPTWAQEAKKKGGILKVAALTNPSSLDPATGGAGTDHVFLWTLFDTLVEWDYATLRTKPGLADWSFPDPKTMLLTIKPGINFHDGTPCDAQAVKFNLDRNRQDARSNLKADLASITAVDVVGALQVKLTLKAPDVVLPAVLSDRAGMMVSPKAVKELGNDHDRKPVGAGPWKFVRWEDNQRVVVTRNENYWKSGEPYADGIEISVITDQATALRSVTAGQNDMVYALSARYKPLIERARNITLVTAPTLYCIQIYFNFGRAPLNNLKVRQAINCAIDRNAFINAGMGGVGEMAAMQLPTSHWAYEKSLADLYKFDPERSRKLLSESGLSNIELSFGGYNDQDNMRRNEIIMEQLGKVGIKAKFTTGTIPDISGQFFGAEKKFDALLSAWTGRPDPSMSYALMYGKEAYFNAGRAEVSPDLAALLQESREKSSIEERKISLSKIQRILVEGAFSAPLAFQFEIAATGARVKGFRPNLLGKPKFNDVSLG